MPQGIKNYYHLLIAIVAVIRFGYPAKKLKVVGITGTDGKTTTATLIYHYLKASKKKVAAITTVGAYVGSEEIDTGLHVTSPDPWVLQKMIRKFVSMGCEYLVLETTSHGLDQYRLFGTDIQMAVFTNITHEHLDYHKTFSNYLKAKSKLFTNTKTAIINKEDKSFKKISKAAPQSAKKIYYDSNSLKGELRKVVIKRFPESYNRLNATAAVLVAREYGIAEKTLIKSTREFKGIVGRMEEIQNNKGIKVIVDFAHTPNALFNILSSLKERVPSGNKLICVVGSAGGRDYKKRPLIGGNSADIADISVFTEDDPRFEDVNEILETMAKGARGTGAIEVKSEDKILKQFKKTYYKIPDRGEAIAFAIQKLAKKGDTVALCSKGHEKSLSYKGVEYPWTDQEAARTSLKGGVKKIKR